MNELYINTFCIPVTTLTKRSVLLNLQAFVFTDLEGTINNFCLKAFFKLTTTTFTTRVPSVGGCLQNALRILT
jgi:hypothetical protein